MTPYIFPAIKTRAPGSAMAAAQQEKKTANQF